MISGLIVPSIVTVVFLPQEGAALDGATVTTDKATADAIAKMPNFVAFFINEDPFVTTPLLGEAGGVGILWLGTLADQGSFITIGPKQRQAK